MKLPSYTLFLWRNCRMRLPKILFPVMFAFIFPLPLIFHLAGRFLLVASISHFLTAPPPWNFHVFLPRNSSPLFWITRSNSFSVIHVSVNIKNNVEKDTTLLLFFLSKSRATILFPAKTPRVACSVVPVYWVILHWYPCGADGRAYDHVIAKISLIGRLPNFHTHGALRAWSSAIKN